MERKDGIPLGGINHKLDDLVIGANSQPCWVYSAYGRKIEKVMNNRRDGATTLILREVDFLEAAGVPGRTSGS